ncbi:MAG: 2-oxoacid:acceptor oxidoreductase family protein, partial [Deltaproteobacteria bacterium]|nr:2-oxoacid:acceptor oxidoreductase family protein [Deltaproteobacteria bacterium]
VVLFDNRPPSYVLENQAIPAHVGPDIMLFGIPFGEIAIAASGSIRGRNLAALGGFSALLGVAPKFFHRAIEKKFATKGPKVMEANLKSFDAGHRYTLETFEDRILDKLAPLETGADSERILLSGNAAIAQGALAANLELYFGYPITPATPIMEYLAKVLPENGGKVMQMEDEIASIGAVIGSFFAGKRSMTATSGPGFALMTELIAHATVTETPAVIVNAQRGGPGTGLPTKTEQSDLQAAVFGGPGDAARIVIAPTNVSECYSFTVKSFQLAEKYQTPVIVLTDFFLNNRVENVAVPSASQDDISDGNIYPELSAKGSYQRFENTKSGISPRAIPGTEGYLFTASGLEHTEKGIPDYTANNHMMMSEKRHRKIQGALQDLPVPVEISLEGDLDLGVIAWGSTFGSALEAVRMAQDKGLNVGILKINAIFPYHAEEIQRFMDKCDRVLIPELNFEGQLANLIGHLHKKTVLRLNEVTGTPMSANRIFKEIVTLSM